MQVACGHNLQLVRIPHCGIKALYGPAQALYIGRACRGKHLRMYGHVAKQPRLFCHHPVLRGWVAHTRHFNRRRPPLAKAALRNAAILCRLVPPEEDEFRFFVVAVLRCQPLIVVSHDVLNFDSNAAICLSTGIVNDGPKKTFVTLISPAILLLNVIRSPAGIHSSLCKAPPTFCNG